MSKGSIGNYFGMAKSRVNLIPIFRKNELEKNPNSFLKTSALIVKKLAIVAPTGTIFTINKAEFLMPSNFFEISYGMIDIKELIFKEDTIVTITYVY